MNFNAKNMSVIAQVPTTVVASIMQLWRQPEWDGGGFDLEHIENDEKELCKKHGVNLRSIMRNSAREDWALFKTLTGDTEQNALELLKSVLMKFKGPKFESYFEDNRAETFFFQGYYAMNHDDAHMGWKRQVMFVLDNPLGHRLWCHTQVTTPKVGDVVLLYPQARHALYPAVGMSATDAAKGPMKLFAAAF